MRSRLAHKSWKKIAITLGAGVSLSVGLAGCSDVTSTSGPTFPGGLGPNGEETVRPCMVQRGLGEAIQWGEADCVAKAIKRGENPNSPLAKQDTFSRGAGLLPLEFALESSQVFFAKGASVVSALLAGGADPNRLFSKGDTALISSLRESDARYLPIAVVLASHPSTKVNLQLGRERTTALVMALEKKKTNVVEALMKRQDLDVDQKSASGEVPVILAARTGQLDVAKALVAKGANLNSVAGDQTSLLMAAIQSGDEPFALQVLGLSNLDVKRAGPGGTTALHLAVEKDNAKLTRELLRLGAAASAATADGNTPLHLASSLDVVQQLLASGASPQARNKTGATPLLLSVRRGNGEVVSALLAKGADANEPANNGSTILFIAIEAGNNDVVRRLTQAGADARRVDREGRSTLIAAIEKGNSEAALLMLNSGADPKIETNNGVMAAHLAAGWSSADVLRAILDKGFDVNGKDRTGRTPLFRAGSAQVATLLISRGAVVNLSESSNGTSPLSEAVGRGLTEVAQILLEAGADKSWTSRQGQGLLALAISGNHLALADLLIRNGLDAEGKGTKVRPVNVAQSTDAIDLLLKHGVQLNDPRELVLNAYLSRLVEGRFGRADLLGLVTHVARKGARSPEAHLRAVTLDEHLFVAALLAGGVDPNEPGPTGQPIVTQVASREMLDVYLKAGVDASVLIANLGVRIDRKEEELAKLRVELEEARKKRAPTSAIAARIRSAEAELEKLKWLRIWATEGPR